MGWLWRSRVGYRNQLRCVEVSERGWPPTGTLTSPEPVTFVVAPMILCNNSGFVFGMGFGEYLLRTLFLETNGFR